MGLLLYATSMCNPPSLATGCAVHFSQARCRCLMWTVKPDCGDMQAGLLLLRPHMAKYPF
ncbi:hypothetical protein DPMN_083545 [Dreissena polymorpha]|uniref:Uncharacterized protein n=1 Tax=Dreissena polymorpha TaxID=45954 RepID=A0A9D4BID2_DREPO|nr:hypothetical protein DPMN_083545 [Dreissena polymorpha]